MKSEVIRLVNAAARAAGSLKAVAMIEKEKGNLSAANHLQKESESLEEALNEVIRRE